VARIGTNGTFAPSEETHAVAERQAAQLIVFVLAMTGMLLALEVGLRRDRRRR
jgi:hypothetical protein